MACKVLMYFYQTLQPFSTFFPPLKSVPLTHSQLHQALVPPATPVDIVPLLLNSLNIEEAAVI